MRKLMTMGMTAVMAAGIAGAESDVVMVGQAPASDRAVTEVTAEAALVSAYVWRGQVYNNDFVVQPQITASYEGFSLNVWGNYDLGKSSNGTQNNFSELDLSVAYTLPLDLNDVSFDVGMINYSFPANGSDVPVAGGGTTPAGSRSTTELFAKGTVTTLSDYVIPSVTMFGSIREAKGMYMLFDVVAPYQVSDYLSVEGGASAGWGNTSYNDYYWGGVTVDGNATGDRDKGFNDFNFYANASYEVLENLSVSANVTYTFLAGGEINNSSKLIYENNKKLWGGVNIAYDF